MIRYAVTVGGVVVGTRGSERTYSHAVVGTLVRDAYNRPAGTVMVLSYARTEELAHKAMNAKRWGIMAREDFTVSVVPVEVR